jgi:hypothetical protein
MATSGTLNLEPGISELSEFWRPVSGYEGYYEVSNFGRVRSVARTIDGRWGKTVRQGCLLMLHRANSRYVKVTLCKDGVMSQMQVHRLVLDNFVGAAPEGFECDHIDYDVTNNALTNLRWLSKIDNNNRRRHVKLNLALAKDIVNRHMLGGKISELAKEFNISDRHVYQVVSGRRWKEAI